jgi:hypothetical protein
MKSDNMASEMSTIMVEPISSSLVGHETLSISSLISAKNLLIFPIILTIKPSAPADDNRLSLQSPNLTLGIYRSPGPLHCGRWILQSSQSSVMFFQPIEGRPPFQDQLCPCFACANLAGQEGLGYFGRIAACVTSPRSLVSGGLLKFATANFMPQRR